MKRLATILATILLLAAALPAAATTTGHPVPYYSYASLGVRLGYSAKMPQPCYGPWVGDWTTGWTKAGPCGLRIDNLSNIPVHLTATVTGEGWALENATADLAVGEWEYIVPIVATGLAPAQVCAKVQGIFPDGGVRGAAQVCTTIRP